MLIQLVAYKQEAARRMTDEAKITLVDTVYRILEISPSLEKWPNIEGQTHTDFVFNLLHRY